MSKPYVDDGTKGINLPADQQRWTGTGFDDGSILHGEIEWPVLPDGVTREDYKLVFSADIVVPRTITEEHPPEECYGNFWHCFTHQLDETPPPGTEPFKSCFECKHVYLTEGDLVDAYNRELAAAEAAAKAKGWAPIEFVPVTSAELIWFCPFCSHDF